MRSIEPLRSPEVKIWLAAWVPWLPPIPAILTAWARVPHPTQSSTASAAQGPASFLDMGVRPLTAELDESCPPDEPARQGKYDRRSAAGSEAAELAQRTPRLEGPPVVRASRGFASFARPRRSSRGLTNDSPRRPR